MIIKIILVIINKGNIENISFLLLLLSSATSLERAEGRPAWERFIISISVGFSIMNRPNASVVIDLVIIIFIIILNILVINPPIIRIKVVLRNLFFILNIMKFLKNYVFNKKICYYVFM